MKRFLRTLRPVTPGGLTAVICSALFAVFSSTPFYKLRVTGSGPKDSCKSVKGTDLYRGCLHEAMGGAARASGVSWNAWHRFVTWVPVVLLLVVACIFVFKLIGYRPKKRRLESPALVIVIVANVLFFWGFTHPGSGEVRAWGAYVALVLLILVDIGALLAFINLDGVLAARAGERERRTTPPDPYDKGHYPVGRSPRYDTPESPRYDMPESPPYDPQQPPRAPGYVPPPE